MSETFELRGARVLLTGSTGGIGQAIGRAVHARGADLVLTGRRGDVLKPLAEELSAETVIADLADPAGLDTLLAGAGEIDVLIANAALPASGAVLDFAPVEIDRALQVNLRAPIALSRALGERMLARGHGHIVLIGSLAGKTATAGSAIYSATKFGLRGFASGFRQDLSGTGVGVSLVQPGFVREAGMFAEAGVSLPPGVRTVSPEDVARAVVESIEHDRGEVNVAPVELRVGAVVGSVVPGLTAALQRRLGGNRIASDVARGQSDKR